MTYTKTHEELAERRKIVSQWIKAGKVETDASRKARREAQKRFNELEHKAELIISGLRGHTTRQNKLSAVLTPKASSSAPVAANTYLSEGDKYDELAVQAGRVLHEILNS